MRRTTVEVTATIRQHPRPVLGAIGLVFGLLCLWYGGVIWAAAYGILATWLYWKYR